MGSRVQATVQPRLYKGHSEGKPDEGLVLRKAARGAPSDPLAELLSLGNTLAVFWCLRSRNNKKRKRPREKINSTKFPKRTHTAPTLPALCEFPAKRAVPSAGRGLERGTRARPRGPGFHRRGFRFRFLPRPPSVSEADSEVTISTVCYG